MKFPHFLIADNSCIFYCIHNAFPSLYSPYVPRPKLIIHVMYWKVNHSCPRQQVWFTARLYWFIQKPRCLGSFRGYHNQRVMCVLWQRTWIHFWTYFFCLFVFVSVSFILLFIKNCEYIIRVYEDQWANFLAAKSNTEVLAWCRECREMVSLTVYPYPWANVTRPVGRSYILCSDHRFVARHRNLLLPAKPDRRSKCGEHCVHAILNSEPQVFSNRIYLLNMSFS